MRRRSCGEPAAGTPLRRQWRSQDTGIQTKRLRQGLGAVMAAAISDCQARREPVPDGGAGGWVVMPLSYAALLAPGPRARILQPSVREKEMSSYTTSEIRGGMKVLLDGEPYAVVENEFVKPGKGQAFNRIKVRNLKTGRTIERTCRSGESLEAADVVDTEMQYLYQDGDFWHFMVPENFEQYTAGEGRGG